MEAISIFDIFKIGVGPSSSHTLGPWKAARDFRASIPVATGAHIRVHLYGSLSKTGKGHATDKAVQLGLLGHDPESIDTGLIPTYIADLAERCTIEISGQSSEFSPGTDIIFLDSDSVHHPNTIEFLLLRVGKLLHSATYLSTGGGFIRKLGDNAENNSFSFPYPIATSTELRQHLHDTGETIAGLVWRNEKHHGSEEELISRITRIYKVMEQSVWNGMQADGILPGGLGTARRAGTMYRKLLGSVNPGNMNDLEKKLTERPHDFVAVNKWVSCFALAVSEENAAMGRIVTSPTNGAAGVIPAVLMYYRFFCGGLNEDRIVNFFCTAGEIGSLFKKGATISAAVGGCQAEIGVSSSMAAAGLVEILGGSPEQVLMAAEIAMEHHLGLTCDPIGGLVQVPCIERNTMGAIKAITAANLAMDADPKLCRVDLDDVIRSMWQTAGDMNNKYKETAEGGLAKQITVAIPDC